MPVSDQQYDANQHEAGKAAVRCNALKYRIGARRTIIPAKMRRYSQWLLRRMARSGREICRVYADDPEESLVANM